jgi:hypothetical protein
MNTRSDAAAVGQPFPVAGPRQWQAMRLPYNCSRTRSNLRQTKHGDEHDYEHGF